MLTDGADEAMTNLLQHTKRIAVVGIKAGERDEAYRVPLYLQRCGYRILPVSPKLERVLGMSAVSTLGELHEAPDLVNLFRASQHIPAHVDEILALPEPPLGVWMQLGIQHADSRARLEAADICVVEDRCLMVEHRRLVGSPSG